LGSTHDKEICSGSKEGSRGGGLLEKKKYPERSENGGSTAIGLQPSGTQELRKEGRSAFGLSEGVAVKEKPGKRETGRKNLTLRSALTSSTNWLRKHRKRNFYLSGFAVAVHKIKRRKAG